MSSISPRERLSRLVELAAETDLAARRALVDGLADLLLDWPESYPVTMREPFEALLEKSLSNVDAVSRAALAERFVGHADAPLHLLNLLVFDADPDTKSIILMRNAFASETKAACLPRMTEERLLLTAVRASTVETLANNIASHFGIAAEIATRILADDSAWMLAALCKGAGFRRVIFSAIAVLANANATTDNSYRRLAVYDTVPQDGATALLAFWRGQIPQPESAAEAA
jgi:hypothetical protein